MCDQSKIAESIAQPEQNTSLGKTSFLLESLLQHLRTPLYANAYYLMANTAVNSLSGFAFWTVAARFYVTDDVGNASAAVSAAVLLSSLSSLGLGTGLIRFLPGAGEASDRMLDTGLTFLTIVSLVASAVFLTGLPLWSPALAFIHESQAFLGAFVAFVLLSALGGLINQVFIARRAAKFTFLCSIITSILKIPLPILFATSRGAFGIFVSVGIAMAVSLGVALTRFLPAIQNGYLPRPRLHIKILSELVPYSFGNQIAALLAQTPQIILPVVVLNALGPKESAYSYVTWMLAGILFMISGAISSSAFAEGSNEEMLLGDSARKAWRLTLLLSAPTVLLMLVIGNRLLLLFGPEYVEGGGHLLTILALSALPVGVNNVYFAVKRVRKEIFTIFLLSALIAGGTLALSHLFMPRHGIPGTGIAWLVSQGTVSVLILYSILSNKLKSHIKGASNECQFTDAK